MFPNVFCRCDSKDQGKLLFITVTSRILIRDYSGWLFDNISEVMVKVEGAKF